MDTIPCCFGIQHKYEENKTPQCVREAFYEYSGTEEVITSKQLIRFFQQSQEEKAVLRGPIANLLLSFPSSTRVPRVVGESLAPPAEQGEQHSEGKGDQAEGAATPGGARRTASHSGGSHRRRSGELLRGFRSMSLEKQQQQRRQLFSGNFNKTLYSTMGNRRNKQEEPNIDLFFLLLINPLATSPVSTKVTQDMTRPLSHYYIYTGHNSYLKGNQLTSESSTKPIIKSLHKGVRVIELDLWPNRENNEILVMHGGTLTKPVAFEECIVAIKDNAFVASEYPVVITLEDHLPPSLQAKAAQVLTRVLGDLLFYPRRPDDLHVTEFRSPAFLRHKIIVSTMPPKQELEEAATPGGGAARGQQQREGGLPASPKPERPSPAEEKEGASAKKDAENSMVAASPSSVGQGQAVVQEIVNGSPSLPGVLFEARASTKTVSAYSASKANEDGKEGEGKALEYRVIITIPGGRLRGATLSEGLRDQDFVRRISLSENEIVAAAKSFPQALVRFTQRNLVRVYPKGTRVLSTNYNPMIAWMHGAQMVALNMQGYGRNLWLVQGFFLANGGCGYVLKPEFYFSRRGQPLAQSAEAEEPRGQGYSEEGVPTAKGQSPRGVPSPSMPPPRAASQSASRDPYGETDKDTSTLNGDARAAEVTVGDLQQFHERSTEAQDPASNHEDGEPSERASMGQAEGQMLARSPAVTTKPDSPSSYALNGTPLHPPASEDGNVFNPNLLHSVKLLLRVKVIVGIDLEDLLISDAHSAAKHSQPQSETGAPANASRQNRRNQRRTKPTYAIKISTEGLPADVDERRLEEKRQLVPNWEDTTLEFAFVLPELALLCIEVTANDRVAGHMVLPVAALLPGFRCVCLHNKKGKSLIRATDGGVRGPRLLCHFTLEQIGSGGNSREEAQAADVSEPLQRASSSSSA